MTEKMLTDLAEVVRLSKKATSGEWVQDNPSSADIVSPIGDVAIAICKAMNNLDLSEKESIAEKKRESAFYNAAFIAASVNFIRAHHATIAQNAEAAKRLNALEQAMDEIDGGHSKQLRERADEIMRGGE